MSDITVNYYIKAKRDKVMNLKSRIFMIKSN